MGHYTGTGSHTHCLRRRPITRFEFIGGTGGTSLWYLGVTLGTILVFTATLTGVSAGFGLNHVKVPCNGGVLERHLVVTVWQSLWGHLGARDMAAPIYTNGHIIYREERLS
ncbi:hypothetical protein XENTR_v10022798 [Xenopus tropicalis]|nr:hypothetical protein XENTR_v10022798 [Xenopus tropicalis]